MSVDSLDPRSDQLISHRSSDSSLSRQRRDVLLTQLAQTNMTCFPVGLVDILSDGDVLGFRQTFDAFLDFVPFMLGSTGVAFQVRSFHRRGERNTRSGFSTSGTFLASSHSCQEVVCLDLKSEVFVGGFEKISLVDGAGDVDVVSGPLGHQNNGHIVLFWNGRLDRAWTLSSGIFCTETRWNFYATNFLKLSQTCYSTLNLGMIQIGSHRKLALSIIVCKMFLENC